MSKPLLACNVPRMLDLQEKVRGLENVHLTPARHQGQYLILKRNYLVRLAGHGLTVSLQKRHE
jgi:hypothetical protein